MEEHGDIYVAAVEV